MNTSSWNKGRIVGQKRPLQISHIWGIRIRLELEGKTRDLAIQFINVKCVHWAIFITMQPHNRCSLTQVLMKPR